MVSVKTISLCRLAEKVLSGTIGSERRCWSPSSTSLGSIKQEGFELGWSRSGTHDPQSVMEAVAEFVSALLGSFIPGRGSQVEVLPWAISRYTTARRKRHAGLKAAVWATEGWRFLQGSDPSAVSACHLD